MPRSRLAKHRLRVFTTTPFPHHFGAAHDKHNTLKFSLLNDVQLILPEFYDSALYLLRKERVVSVFLTSNYASGGFYMVFVLDFNVL